MNRFMRCAEVSLDWWLQRGKLGEYLNFAGQFKMRAECQANYKRYELI